MRITIDDTFAIDKEGFLCYTLKARTDRKDKEGNDIYTVYGYYTNLESALQKYKTIKTDQKFEGQVVTIGKYIKELREQNDAIRDLLVEVEE